MDHGGQETLEVAFARANGVAAWKSRSCKSDVPDEWPYGLNRLAMHFDDVRAADLDRASVWSLALSLSRLRSFQRKSVDVSIAWDERAAVRMVNRRAATRMLCGVIWATDEVCRGERKFENRFVKKILRQMDGVWCLSRAQLPVVADWLGRGGPAVCYLPFGIDETFYTYVPYPTGRSPIIVSFGIDRDRDPETLFESLDLVIKHRPDVRALVQTDSELTAPTGVKKIGRVSHRDVHRMYGESALAMVATRQNLHASGLTVTLEAMSTGRPVVISGTPGLEDYVENGVSGYLVEPECPEGMARAALSVLGNPEVAIEMGRAGRLRVEKNFTTALMSRHIADMVSSLNGVASIA
ncbi:MULTISPECIES: glycosyltransferase family 4 protein [unclassified Rhodococcus (in: high G+C Gram-positive bacteria)]|uniref:glycosyltransferase family 4 protein n=1 Tax=unclassified Rhodococcus (in: high G+C Gram-positive bacteria) TaxID=192944 RepID=UPI0009FF25CA|nr:glycosyltransferase family 4 protein [Rhodococcus sp. DK17]